MPEGPEVRRAADKIERALKENVIQRVEAPHAAIASVAKKLKGARCLAVETYGKAFVLRFDRPFAVYVHLQLYGVWKSGKASRYQTLNRSLRFTLHTENAYASLYSATDILVLKNFDVPEHPYISKLGIDALKKETTAESLFSYLKEPKFQRRELGLLLLDQKFVAGIGNYLRSEILHIANIHPDTKLKELTETDKRELANVIKATCTRAYKASGVTTTKEYVKNAKDHGRTRRQYRHYVFGRAERACPTCKRSIQKITRAGRNLFLCESCQPHPASAQGQSRYSSQ